MSTLPTLVAHADWSVTPKKRWLAVATPRGTSCRVRLEPVDAGATLLARLRREADGQPVLFGVDAPIGLPHAYAIRHHGSRRNFADFIRTLSTDDEFFIVCDQIEEVSGARPFFPRTTRLSPRRQAQAERLGLAHPDELLRRCDRKTADRNRAASLFWTLGPNQVGKAAISLWREVLIPAVQAPEPPALWPFEGDLNALLRRSAITVAETYPAEALSRLKPRWRGSKRRQADRARLAADIGLWMASLHAETEPGLAATIDDGFGSSATGEDQFDAVLGLLLMLEVVGQPGAGIAPADAAIAWEGWILGQRA